MIGSPSRCTGALALFALLWSFQLAAQPAGSDDIARTTTLCGACHRDKFEERSRNPHTALDSTEWQERTQVALGCLNCHGDVSAHIRAGGGRGNVFAFREETPLAKNDACLGCHRDTHPAFDRSPHALAGLSCVSCHSQHADSAAPALLIEARRVAGDAARLGPATNLCVDCHAETLADFAFNESHRLREGIVECTSCHDPHAAASRSLLGGFKQQQCLECHTDKGGPFVFEHPAARAEGCTACHKPHGAPNRHMLTHQRVGELCITCHAAVPQFHSGFGPTGPPRFGLDTQCTNCHSTIHGSNFDPFFLK